MKAWSQDELVTIDFLLVLNYNVALKVEELELVYFERLDDCRLDIVAKKPVDKWELTIEWDSPIFTSDGMCVNIFP